MENIGNVIIDLPEIDFENPSILKILIDGTWSSQSFAYFFQNVDFVYKSQFLTYKAIKITKDFISNPNNRNINFVSFAHTPLAHQLERIKWDLETLHTEGRFRPNFIHPYSKVEGVERLTVQKVEFASPGATDFLGIAGILKEIREALAYYLPNEMDKQKAEITRQQKIDLKIKNLKAVGFSDIEIRTILLREDVRMQHLSEFIQEGLISDAQVVNVKTE
jgi:hypothetical protein